MKDEFIVHGYYHISNLGGYEIMVSSCNEAAKVRDSFGSNNPQTSDWLEIEYLVDEESKLEHPVIDPNGYNISLNEVLKV
jgi:hypothetical protein